MAALPTGALVTADDGVEIGPQIFEFLQPPWDPHAISAIEYALTNVLTELVTVPGSWGPEENPRTPETISRGRAHLLVLLRRWFDCITTVHRCGYSLRGQFTAARFLVNARLQVRLTMTGGIHLYHYTRHNGGLDYTALAGSIEEFRE